MGNETLSEGRLETLISEVRVSPPKDILVVGDFPPISAETQRKIFFLLPSRTRRYLMKVLDGVEATIRLYEPGPGRSRYQTVWKAACQLGKLMIIAPNITEDILLPAIEHNPHFLDWDKNPTAVVQSGYSYGRSVIDEEFVAALNLPKFEKVLQVIGVTNDEFTE